MVRCNQYVVIEKIFAIGQPKKNDAETSRKFKYRRPLLLNQ